MIFYNEMSNYNENPIVSIPQNQILHDTKQSSMPVRDMSKCDTVL